jgi:hypothetical protein
MCGCACACACACSCACSCTCGYGRTYVCPCPCACGCVCVCGCVQVETLETNAMLCMLARRGGTLVPLGLECKGHVGVGGRLLRVAFRQCGASAAMSWDATLVSAQGSLTSRSWLCAVAKPAELMATCFCTSCVFAVRVSGLPVWTGAARFVCGVASCWLLCTIPSAHTHVAL